MVITAGSLALMLIAAFLVWSILDAIDADKKRKRSDLADYWASQHATEWYRNTYDGIGVSLYGDRFRASIYRRDDAIANAKDPFVKLEIQYAWFKSISEKANKRIQDLVDLEYGKLTMSEQTLLNEDHTYSQIDGIQPVACHGRP
jgi:hypothetical protein